MISIDFRYLWNALKFSFRFRWTGYKQVKIYITRLDVTDHGIFGHLTLDSGPFNCVTLENHIKCVKEGAYTCKVDMSPRLGFLTPHIAVPDRDKAAGGDAGIRFHPLNWESQSEGCIGVGVERDGWAIDSSKQAFNDLMQQLEGCKDITVIIK